MGQEFEPGARKTTDGKAIVQITGVDEYEQQQTILVTPQGKIITRVTGLDENGVQRTILLTPQGKVITCITGLDENGVQRVVKTKDDGTVVTEDTGEHSNPEKFVTDHGFSSQVATSPDALRHPLFDPGTFPARTAGLNCYVYEILVYNHSGAAVTVHLELIDGTVVSIDVAVANLDTAVASLAKPIVFGDRDIYYRASAANVDVQVTGLEV